LAVRQYEISDALAGIGDAVMVKVGPTSSDLASVTYAVAVAVGLVRVVDGGAVVGEIREPIVIRIY
jgi:hypothetical protein